MPNRLIRETSPYLLQHAHNPVDWYPWCEEAFQRARAEDKPILLSIGYSACHWCHVMERESFENERIAELMNSHFVNIKVDREERPDLDSIYMAAVQAMTGRGGWPMTVFLTPDGVPFYGGTYYPPEDRMGMPGFPRVLLGVADAYAKRRSELLQGAEQLVRQIEQGAGADAEEAPDPTTLESAARVLGGQFDFDEGGFGGAPKFPQPMVLELLLRTYRRAGDATALQMVELTLERMARGGIYDQLGGGFHRYATDGHWLVPHFEKMLYDNAQLVQAYLHAFQITGASLYRRIAAETLDYVLREMTSPEGAFYSTQDADSEGEEGKFFVWTEEEIERSLDRDDARVFMRYYGVTPEGNWEGKNILNVSRETDALAAELDMQQPSLVAAALDRSRQRMFALREQRIHPCRDDKILASWNGMMLKAFAEASAILARPDYARVAKRNAAFLLGEFWSEGQLIHSYTSPTPESAALSTQHSALPGFLEDYANLIDGLLALYQVTFDPAWFSAAREIADTMLERFWESDERRLYDTAKDHERLFSRPRDLFDNATPSGNSVAADVLLRLWLFTGEARYRDVAGHILASVQPLAASYPLGFGRLLCAYDLYFADSREIAIVGQPDSPNVASFRQAIWSRYLPNAVVAGCAPEDRRSAEIVPLLAGKSTDGEHPAAYVCQRFTCQAPVTDPEELIEQLSS